jgi:hypothetical protein
MSVNQWLWENAQFTASKHTIVFVDGVRIRPQTDISALHIFDGNPHQMLVFTCKSDLDDFMQMRGADTYKNTN